MSDATVRLRYVVLRHEGISQPHFDFMVETSRGSPLATWRVEQWPPHPGEAMERLADHRQAYLTYEGPVSGDRGYVRRVTGGQCIITGIDSDDWTIRFDDNGPNPTRPRAFGDRVMHIRQRASDSTLWQVLT